MEHRVQSAGRKRSIGTLFIILRQSYKSTATMIQAADQIILAERGSCISTRFTGQHEGQPKESTSHLLLVVALSLHWAIEAASPYASTSLDRIRARLKIAVMMYPSCRVPPSMLSCRCQSSLESSLGPCPASTWSPGICLVRCQLARSDRLTSPV